MRERRINSVFPDDFNVVYLSAILLLVILLSSTFATFSHPAHGCLLIHSGLDAIDSSQ